MKHVDSGLWDWVLWLDWDVMVADQTAMMRTIFENVLPSHALIASGPPKEKPWGVQVFSRRAEGAARPRCWLRPG